MAENRTCEFYTVYAEHVSERLAAPEMGDAIADYRGFPLVQWAIVADDLISLAESMRQTGQTANAPELTAIDALTEEAKANSGWLWWPEEMPADSAVKTDCPPIARFGGLAVTETFDGSTPRYLYRGGGHDAESIAVNSPRISIGAVPADRLAQSGIVSKVNLADMTGPAVVLLQKEAA